MVTGVQDLNRACLFEASLHELWYRFVDRKAGKMLGMWASSLADYEAITLNDVDRACLNWYNNEDKFPASYKQIRARVFELKEKAVQTFGPKMPMPCRVRTCDGSGFIEMARPDYTGDYVSAACPCSNITTLPTLSQLKAVGFEIHPDYVERLFNRDDSAWLEQRRTFEPLAAIKPVPELVQW